MKRLASRLTWWPTRSNKSTPVVNAAVRRGQPWIILASTSTRGKARAISGRAQGTEASMPGRLGSHGRMAGSTAGPASWRSEI
jgi:hypothetical protein